MFRKKFATLYTAKIRGPQHVLASTIVDRHDSSSYSIDSIHTARPVGTNLKVRGHEKKLALTTYLLKSKGELPCVINSVFSTVK